MTYSLGSTFKKTFSIVTLAISMRKEICIQKYKLMLKFVIESLWKVEKEFNDVC